MISRGKFYLIKVGYGGKKGLTFVVEIDRGSRNIEEKRDENLPFDSDLAHAKEVGRKKF